MGRLLQEPTLTKQRRTLMITLIQSIRNSMAWRSSPSSQTLIHNTCTPPKAQPTAILLAAIRSRTTHSNPATRCSRSHKILPLDSRTSYKSKRMLLSQTRTQISASAQRFLLLVCFQVLAHSLELRHRTSCLKVSKHVSSKM